MARGTSSEAIRDRGYWLVPAPLVPLLPPEPVAGPWPLLFCELPGFTALLLFGLVLPWLFSPGAPVVTTPLPLPGVAYCRN